MKRFFSSDSIAIRLLTAFCNIMLINVLFIFTSIPLFTIGAGITAMYSTIFKWTRGEDPAITKTYFATFKENFKQATQVWIPFLIFIISLSVSLYFTHNNLDESYKFMQYPISIALFLLICIINYIFPQIAIFKQKSSIIIRNACLLALANFPTTFLMIILPVILFLIAGYSGLMTVRVLSILLFFGIALITYFYSIFLRRIFNKLIENEDEWI